MVGEAVEGAVSGGVSRSAATKLAVLSVLYFAQGLPFGFFSQSIPVLMRQGGASLLAVSASNLLALPWVLKALWAPLFDRAGLSNPRARRWTILGLQAGSALLLLTAMGFDPAQSAVAVGILVVLSNLLSATQDIPTDATTVETLGPELRGLGNGAQVAGYRLGMVVGGGVMLAVLEDRGWAFTVGLLAVAMLVTAIPLLIAGPLARGEELGSSQGLIYPSPALREKVPASSRADEGRSTSPGSPHPPPGTAAPSPGGRRGKPELGTAGGVVYPSPENRSWLGVLVIYKLGDAFGTGSIRPMLVDFGFDLSDIGWLLGTLGSGAAVTGSLLGGVLVTRLARPLPAFALFQACGLGLWVIAAQLQTTPWVAIAVTLEHFTSGMATTALFTAMMSRCRPDRAASDYATQASTVLVAQGVAAILSGGSAELFGYTGHLMLGTVLAVIAVGVVSRR